MDFNFFDLFNFKSLIEFEIDKIIDFKVKKFWRKGQMKSNKSIWRLYK
jgi:hypothetical protein